MSAIPNELKIYEKGTLPESLQSKLFDLWVDTSWASIEAYKAAGTLPSECCVAWSSIEAVTEELESDKTTLRESHAVIAFQETRPVGLICYEKSSEELNDFFISIFAVSPTAQRQGLGRQLFQTLFQAHPGKAFHWKTAPFNTAGVACYARLGFKSKVDEEGVLNYHHTSPASSATSTTTAAVWPGNPGASSTVPKDIGIGSHPSVY